MSRREYEMSESRVKKTGNTSMMAKESQLKERLAECDAEIKRYEDERKSIEALIAFRDEERQRILQELESLRLAARGEMKGKSGIDYGSGDFEWSGGLKAKISSVFGIRDFRLCQRGYEMFMLRLVCL
jgi:ATP-dependent DNA helicase Q1